MFLIMNKKRKLQIQMICSSSAGDRNRTSECGKNTVRKELCGLTFFFEPLFEPSSESLSK